LSIPNVGLLPPRDTTGPTRFKGDSRSTAFGLFTACCGEFRTLAEFLTGHRETTTLGDSLNRRSRKQPNTPSIGLL